MLSMRQKQFIAAEIEKMLLNLNHPELPKEKISFHLHVDGIDSWSYADIEPNWTFNDENPPGINPFNEIMGHLKQQEQDDA